MNITLTPNQERLVLSKLQAGKYQSAEEILELALRLLDEYERSEAEWVVEVRRKIEAAIEASNNTDPINGERFVSGILERFRQTDRV